MTGGRARLARRLRRLPAARRGAMAAEFAMVIPVLLAFSFAIIEFGRAMWMRNTMQSVVEDSARCFALDRAELTTRNCDTTAKVQTYAATSANNAGVTSLTSGNFAVTTETCGKQVVATYSFQPVVPLIPTFSMTAKACRAATPAP